MPQGAHETSLVGPGRLLRSAVVLDILGEGDVLAAGVAEDPVAVELRAAGLAEFAFTYTGEPGIVGSGGPTGYGPGYGVIVVV